MNYKTKLKNNNLKKIITYSFFVAIFVMYAYVIINQTVKSQNVSWQDFASFDYEQETVMEDGKEVTYNLVSTPQQLAGVFARSNAVVADNAGTHFKYDNKDRKYKLTNNIDLSGRSWTPTNNSNILDGNNFTISNLDIKSNARFVGFVSENLGTIKNIIFENVSVKNTKTDGGDTGTAVVAGHNKGTIQNIVVESGSVLGNIHTSNTNYDRKTGGIVGWQEGGKTYNCINRASIGIGKHIGGIVGIQSSGGEIKNCYNYGAIDNSADNNDSLYIRMGGIIGEIQGGTILASYNEGKVKDQHS